MGGACWGLGGPFPTEPLMLNFLHDVIFQSRFVPVSASVSGRDVFIYLKENTHKSPVNSISGGL